MTNYSFFIDIDGTLICPKRPFLSDKFRAVAKEVRSKGAKLFINTARSRAIVPSAIADPEIFDGICSGGGTHIELHGKCVYSRYLSEELLLEIAETYERLGEKFSLIFEGAEHMLYMGDKNSPLFEKYLKMTDIYIHLNEGSKTLRSLCKNAKIQKFYIPTANGISPSKEFLDEMSVKFDLINHNRYIEAMEYGFDKGGAIRIAERELNIPHEATVAIGDSKNDLAMLKYAKTSVAMGNATDDIKEICTLVTDSAEDDGVANVIEKLCSED